MATFRDVLELSIGIAVGSPTILSEEQEGFRWRADDGSESTATWLAIQDTNITRAILTNTRLRVLVNVTSNPDPAQYQLEYRKVGDTDWKKVNP